MNLTTLRKHTSRVQQILDWIEEDPSIAMLFNGSAKQPVKSERHMNNLGFTAQVLRALSSRTLSIGQLRGISRMSQEDFGKNIAYLYRRKLIEDVGKNVVLTDTGKEEAKYFIEHPEAKVRRHRV